MFPDIMEKDHIIEHLRSYIFAGLDVKSISDFSPEVRAPPAIIRVHGNPFVETRPARDESRSKLVRGSRKI